MDPLHALFGSRARVAILRLFMLDPTRAYYQRQIEGAAGLPIRAIQRELSRFTEAGLFYRRSEGNRAYYKVDTTHPLFEALRDLIRSTAHPLDHLRSELALNENVRLAFAGAGGRVLVVAHSGRRLALATPPGLRLDVRTSDAFCAALHDGDPTITTYLENGEDLLGARDDVIWRDIEAAGFQVAKRKGVA